MIFRSGPDNGRNARRSERQPDNQGKGMIRKKGKTCGLSLLVRLPRAAAPFLPTAVDEILSLRDEKFLS